MDKKQKVNDFNNNRVRNKILKFVKETYKNANDIVVSSLI